MESRELKWMKCTKCGMSLCESETAKRKPLPDGSLELTSEELCKFNQLMELTEIKKVFVKNGFIYYTFFDLDIILSELKAILYLNTLFDLNMEAKSE